jgi:hypothetical protein
MQSRMHVVVCRVWSVVSSVCDACVRLHLNRHVVCVKEREGERARGGRERESIGLAYLLDRLAL